jgi:hypothetical protein
MGVSINTTKSLGVSMGNRITPPKASGFENLKSIDLDGANMYVNCGPLNSILGIDAWSVSAWINRDTGTGLQTIINLKENSYHGHDFNIFHWEASTRLDVNVNGANAFRDSSISLNDDQWYHILIICDKTESTYSDKCKVYLDGTLLTNATGTNMQQIADTNNDVTIGMQLKGTTLPYVKTAAWNGLIDEVAFWDKALSASEAGDVYNSGTPGDLSSMSNLTNWWRMGDVNGATGTNVPDQGSEGADATLINSPTYSSDVPT